MTSILRTIACLAASLTIAGAALAQPSNVNPIRKFSWSETCGYMNWRDAGSPPGAQGARVGTSFMSGYVWFENAGWLTLGDGTPGGPGGQYGNTDGSDCGVNIAPNGDLFGFGWHENLGWINFDTRLSLTPFSQQARFDAAAKRLRGFAWAENAGWINLNDANVYVSTGCPADFDGDGRNSIDDLFIYLNAWLSGDPRCDVNGGGVSIDDLFIYMNLWFQGC